MASDQTERPQYFEDQYLGADDLNTAVDYSRIQNAKHLLGAHTWGIAMGLGLQEKPIPGSADSIDVYIQPGYAWDGFGRPIIVLAPFNIPKDQFKGLTTSSPDGSMLVDIWLRYDETAFQSPPPWIKPASLSSRFPLCECEYTYLWFLFSS